MPIPVERMKLPKWLVYFGDGDGADCAVMHVEAIDETWAMRIAERDIHALTGRTEKAARAVPAPLEDEDVWGV